ncbi:hypothetical protein Q9L58_008330 [Maublancomyces gigas]|uniref:Uncharacterized protein n=1 Tax=Discina gigas TaxID=1032678 RepID=A0ABR3GA38_9PEZI
MKQDGSRITLIPSPTGDTTCIHILPITKADIKGALSTPEDEKLVFMLDLDNYRERLIKARRELAFTRMICYLKGLRKRKRTDGGDADSESDFDNEEGEEGDKDKEKENEAGEEGQEQEVRRTRRKIARVGGSPPGG